MTAPKMKPPANCIAYFNSSTTTQQRKTTKSIIFYKVSGILLGVCILQNGIAENGSMVLRYTQKPIT